MVYLVGSWYVALILVLLLSASVFAFPPVARTPFAGTIRTFVAFYLLLLGLAILFNPVGAESGTFGALLAALGLTYFWAKLRLDK